MAVDTVTYDGSVSTTEFDYPYAIGAADELVVCKLRLPDMAPTVLRRDLNDYTVDGLGASPAKVTLTTALVVGSEILCVQRQPTVADADNRNDGDTMEFRHRVMRTVRDFITGDSGVDLRLVKVANIQAPTELASIQGRDTPPTLLLAYQDGSTDQDESTLYIWDGRAGFSGLAFFRVAHSSGTGGWAALAGVGAVHSLRADLGVVYEYGLDNPATHYFVRANSSGALTPANQIVGTFTFLEPVGPTQMGALTAKVGSATARSEIIFATKGSAAGVLSAIAFKEDQTVEASDWGLATLHGSSPGNVRAGLVTELGGYAVRMVWSGPVAGAGSPVHGMPVKMDPAAAFDDAVIGLKQLNPAAGAGNFDAEKCIGILYARPPVSPLPTGVGSFVWVVVAGYAEIRLSAYSTAAGVTRGDWVHQSWATDYTVDALTQPPAYAVSAAPGPYAGGGLADFQSLYSLIGKAGQTIAPATGGLCRVKLGVI